MTILDHAATPQRVCRTPGSLVATVRKSFDFPAAHANAHHAGHCSNVHGHTWVLEIFVKGPVIGDDDRPDHGMVVDFASIKDAYRTHVEPYVEHQFLNESLAPFGLPEYTTEWIAAWILEQLRAALPGIVRVRLWEGRTSYAEVEA
jgi:6-pyruvoyltetrahydropterin/6-carboxytetrahydropterin synthase